MGETNWHRRRLTSEPLPRGDGGVGTAGPWHLSHGQAANTAASGTRSLSSGRLC
ncbi:hypothetical protein ACU639_00545 [Streptomyces cynarae]|uniref:hypothetical protein n=1 Tax=Streptomyces cynarae TaxID=2981134 RepID=UPI00406C6CE1